MIAVSFGHLVSPLAEGSGLPQLKSILGGTPISGYFSWRVLVAKLLGTWTAQVAGLSLGKEVREYRADMGGGQFGGGPACDASLLARGCTMCVGTGLTCEYVIVYPCLTRVVAIVRFVGV